MNTTSQEDLDPIARIVRAFEVLGNGRYGSEKVSQLQHALQTASFAMEAHASVEQVSAALLHDLGHILPGGELPKSDDSNLDDRHEETAFQWLNSHFGPKVAEPVRLHVAAKRFLCTTQTEYSNTLSPTSLKSYFDQGGPMSQEERLEFQSNHFFEQAVELRKWDDLAKDPNKITPDIAFFIPYLKASLQHNG